MLTLLEKLNRDDRFAASIGARLTDVGEGYARAELTVEERHLNGGGVCQGGVIYTLADLSFAAVANSHGILTFGVNNSITFLKSGMLGDTLIAECREEYDHRKLPYCNIRVSNERGELIAMMTGLAYRTGREFEFEGLR